MRSSVFATAVVAMRISYTDVSGQAKGPVLAGVFVFLECSRTAIRACGHGGPPLRGGFDNRGRQFSITDLVL